MGISVVGRLFRSVKQYRMMSSRSSSRRRSGSVIAPWLMLYPHFKKEDKMAYKFLSLKDDKVEKFDKRGADGEVPANSCRTVESSHGWLALFNERNGDLFLTDPVNRRHIRLPNIQTLPDTEIDLFDWRGSVSKLILSCSPDKDECRAMMMYGDGGRLADCSPQHSTSWTPLSSLFIKDSEYEICNGAKVYSDVVYWSKRKRFICITPCFRTELDRAVHERYDDQPSRWEQWDNSGSVLIGSGNLSSDFFAPENRLPAWAEMERNQKTLDECPLQISYLVYAEESDKIYVLVRYVDGCGTYLRDDPDLMKNNFFKNKLAFMGKFGYRSFEYNPFLVNDPYVTDRNMSGGDSPYNTVGFIAFEYNGELQLLDSLDGLAMFVGINHGFAIPASKYPELNLKPHSIYFTDDVGRVGSGLLSSRMRYGWLDAGNIIYPPCTNKFHPPAHNGSYQWIRHPPVWFTPNAKAKANAHTQ